MQKHIQILADIVAQEAAAQRPVSRPLAPAEITEALDLSLREEGVDLQQIAKTLAAYTSMNPDVSQVGFHKQLYSGRNAEALLGEWVASLSNAVMHTYKVGPVAAMMELEIIDRLNGLIGFDKGDGIMVSGASQANLIAMMLARHAMCPDLKSNGYAGRTLTAFVSDQAHYSMLRAANVAGIGEDNLIKVKSDAQGRMDPSDLRTKIMAAEVRGHIPFFVGLTAGTTVLGAFDPVKPCLQIARDHGMWLHIDGAWGGPILFSEEHRHVLDGCAEADSFTWDAHKFMNVPLTAGIILVREAGQMTDAISGGGGEYLFHEGDARQTNFGQMSIQSARRADCLKVWTAWKGAGSKGYADKMNHLREMTDGFCRMVDASPQAQIIGPAPFLNILFQIQPSGVGSDRYDDLNIAICNKLASDGNAFVDYASWGGRTGIRLVLANQDVNKDYLDRFLELCLSTGNDLARQFDQDSKHRPVG